MQTCVLRVNIHCDGCKQKVRKVLQKIDGVDNIAIDGEHGKVVVSGSIDPATIMRKLAKAGKHADLWSTLKGGNSVITNKQLKNQYHSTQIDHKNDQRDVKSQMGGCKNQKNASLPPQQQQQLELQQLNGLKGVKQPQSKSSWFPFKRQKSVKSTRREGDLGDEFDMFDDEFDEFDDDFDLDDDVLMKPHPLNDKQIKPKNGQVPVKGFMNGQVNGGNFKTVQVPIKDGKNQGAKHNNGGNKLWPGNNGGVNQSKNAGGKNGEWKNKIAPNMANVGGAKGNIHQKVWGDQGFLEVDLSKKASNGGGIMGGSGKMGYSALPPPAANPAVQRLPMNAGNSFGGVVSPPEKMSGNQYLQQQYIAQMMMLQQQQQQQQQRYNAGFQPLSFGRQQPSVSYGPQMPPSHYYPPPTPEYAHYFNDENTNSCSIM